MHKTNQTSIQFSRATLSILIVKQIMTKNKTHVSLVVIGELRGLIFRKSCSEPLNFDSG